MKAGSRAAVAAALAAALGVPAVARSQTPGPFDPPPGYYDRVADLVGPDLRSGLNDIIDGHLRRSYDDVWTMLEGADSVETAPGSVLTVYSNRMLPAIDHTQWTREHSWPKSYGFPDDDACNYPYTDGHHLFPETQSYNSSRNNGPFDDCPDHSAAEFCDAKPADGQPDEYGNWRTIGSGEWEVWFNPLAQPGDLPVGRRGDIARAMFYMDVRYEGEPNPLPACAGQTEPELVLTDAMSLITSTSSSPAYMGRLETLLEWHNEEPVDHFEQRRNALIMTPQANRNPFVDHPEWVATLWAGSGGAPPTLTPTATRATLTPTPGATSLASLRIFLPHASKAYWVRAPASTPRPSSTPTSPPATATSVATNTSEPPTATSTVPTATHTRTPTQGPPTVTATAAPAQLVIGTLRCDTSDEMIRVDNVGGATAQLSGWEIVSVVGPQTFDFPAYSLAAGASVYVHSGPDAPPTGGNIIRWTTASVWNNNGDSAELRNPSGGLVDQQGC